MFLCRKNKGGFSFFHGKSLMKDEQNRKKTYVDEYMNREGKRLILLYYLISIMLFSVPHYSNNWPILYIFTFFNTE